VEVIMRRSKLFAFLMAVLLAGFIPPAFSAAQSTKEKNPANPQTQTLRGRDARRVVTMLDEVRHQLVMLPYYSVFDWLEAEGRPDGTVVLRGDVIKPSTKSDAEARVKQIESVSKVVNEVEVLPLMPTDDQLRVALYRSIYKYDSPMFRYGTQAVPPIHIIVKSGHVTLKGIVDSEADSQLAFMAANSVSGVFEVKNELKVAPAALSRK
jgi:hyperosmotically inducible protein